MKVQLLSVWAHPKFGCFIADDKATVPDEIGTALIADGHARAVVEMAAPGMAAISADPMANLFYAWLAAGGPNLSAAAAATARSAALADDDDDDDDDDETDTETRSFASALARTPAVVLPPVPPPLIVPAPEVVPPSAEAGEPADDDWGDIKADDAAPAEAATTGKAGGKKAK